MALVINTNISALIAQQNLATTSSHLQVSVQRLSSGYRVNSAADDAAGLARADQLKSQSRMIQAAMRNVNDGVSALEISDKAAEQITNIVTRMGELAASAAQGTLDASTRSYYSGEYNKLISEINRIAETTEFGGHSLINGSSAALTLQIGFKTSTNDQLSITLMGLTAGTVSGLALTTTASGGDITSVADALSAMDAVSSALKVISDARAIHGASSSRLTVAISNLQVSFTNYQSAESRIRDADFAYETSIYARNQIMVQVGTSILAQANTQPQAALTLLR
ncbi:MAG: flagellin FliC [Deltaproteobacteria bacterium]|nr:flagellin FliC [Deltaproteobacteria bacterium]